MNLESATRAVLAIPPERLLDGARIPARIVADDRALTEDFAEDMLAQYRRLHAAGRRPVVFVAPIGPTGQYDRLAELCNAVRQPLADLLLIGMDEYLTPTRELIAIDDALSFRRHMRDHFWAKLDPALAPPEANRVFPDPRDPAALTRLIERHGGADVCYGGVGINGHIAFNEPPEPDEPDDVAEFAARPTRIVAISRETRVINAVTATRGNLDRMPREAVTVGMKEILASRALRIYVTRPWKCAIVRKILHGPVTARAPASLAQRHPDAQVILTREVAQLPEPELR